MYYINIIKIKTSSSIVITGFFHFFLFRENIGNVYIDTMENHEIYVQSNFHKISFDP